MARIAMIGATGLIGQSLAPMLVAQENDLLAIGRRASGVPFAHDIIADADHWGDALKSETIDIAISTLGTTRKAAGSMEAFEAVDRYAVVAFARAAYEAGARQWLMVSSVGADPSSRNSYLAVKGRAEADILSIGFARVDIFRPGLLTGKREQRRLGEGLAKLLAPLTDLLMSGPLDLYQSIPAVDVAKAIDSVVGEPGEGQFIHHNREIRGVAEAIIRPAL